MLKQLTLQLLIEFNFAKTIHFIAIAIYGLMPNQF